MVYLISLFIECLAGVAARCKLSLPDRRPLASEGDARCANCGYPVRQSLRWQATSGSSALRCRACDSPLAFDGTASLSSRRQRHASA